jgi:hypothetical protein
MKNFKKSVLVLLLATATTFSSCTKSDITPAISGSGTVTATIGSISFNSTITNIAKIGNTITIQGAQTDGKSIGIQVIGLSAAPTTGTYKLYDDGSNFVSTATYVAGANQTYSSIGCDSSLPRAGFVPTGTVTFTEISATKIAGTFQFNCTSVQNCSDVKIVSSGAFSKTF